MKQRGVLLRLPGLPFTFDDLCPDHFLATAGAALQRAGWDIVIADAGNIDSLHHARQTLPHTYRPELNDIDRALEFNTLYTSHLHNAVPDTQALAQNPGYGSYCEKYVATIASPGHRFVLVYVSQSKDMDTATLTVKRVRSHAPRTRIIAAGPYFQGSETAAVQAAKLFDCVYVGRPDDETLVQLVESVDRPTLWRNLPNLVHESGVSLRISRTEPGTLYTDLSSIYDISAYTSLNDETRLPIFDVEDVVRAPVGTLGHWEILHARPVESVVNDMVDAADPSRCAGISLRGCTPRIPHAERIAYELLKRRAQIRYCRDAHVESVVPQGLPSVHASGCRVLRFQLHSGSQRLIDDVYGDCFSISQAERVIRAAKFSNMFTVAGFTYPCPEDDYHTRAESLRIIDRCRPNSVALRRYSGPLEPRRGWKTWFQGLDADRVQRKALIEELEANGHVCSVSPKAALFAERAGQKGNEKRFADLLDAAVRRADTEVLRHFVHAALKPQSMDERTLLAFRPFISKRHVVGN
jgi:hypothetical protein